jgi:hypothetical protein
MSSIFVAVPTLRDPQYVKTITDIFENSSGDHEIFVGTAITTDDRKFVKRVYKALRGYKNLKFIELDPMTQFGVGNGRFYSYSLYSGQDYVMQLDSHTKLERDWDNFVINLYQEALDHTQNPKTIVTTYLGRYEDDGKERIILDDRAKYATFLPNTFYGGLIPRWEVLPPSDLDSSYSQYRWLPANIFGAQFAISDYRLASVYDDNKDAYFLDEETVNTINLLDMGYSLVYPNVSLPLTHLYGHEKGGVYGMTNDPNVKNLRDHLGSLSGVSNDTLGHQVAAKRFNRYIKDNPDKVKRFEEYVGFKIISGPKKILQVPKEMNR